MTKAEKEILMSIVCPTTQEGYSVYSPFDMEQHKRTFVNYLEVIIDADGNIMYAVPSHQEKLIQIACEKKGITRLELSDKCPPEYYADFLLWLTKETGCISVWEYGCVGYANKKQSAALLNLKLNGLYRGKINQK